MRLIKRESTVPIPEVYSFNASTDNDLGCPFILMDYVDAVSLYEIWFEDTFSKAVMEQRRARILQDLAAAVVQLNQFAYRQGGRLLFDDDGNPTSVGPMRKLDVSSMLDRQRTGDLDEPFVFCELGAFMDSKAFLLCMLDRRLPPPDQFGQGIYTLLCDSSSTGSLPLITHRNLSSFCRTQILTCKIYWFLRKVNCGELLIGMG